MTGFRARKNACRRVAIAAAVLAAVAFLAAPAVAQIELMPSAVSTGDSDGDMFQTGCSSCGNGGGTLGMPPLDIPGGSSVGGGGGDGSCCCGCGANPPCLGQKPCYPCDDGDCVHRFCCCLYNCICCKDPCYEGHWIPQADSAFFTESARPITQQRVRWDYGEGLIFADRAEYFMAAPINKTTGGRGLPSPGLSAAGVVLQPPFAEPSWNYNFMSLYTEVAASAVSFFVEVPYETIDPVYRPSTTTTINGVPTPNGLASNVTLNAHHAGFGDMNVGTKTLMYDCELLQLGFMFKTYLPVGRFNEGIGNGHVSLEPSLLFDLKIGPETYFESQLSEWIPLGGDPGSQGAILHWHLAVNQTLYRPVPNVPIIGTVECIGWSFQNGQYTDPTLGFFQKAGEYTYLYGALGLRLVVCDRIDFGIAYEQALTHGHFAEDVWRSEVRWRF